jgi:hypothetical protein
MKKKFSWGTGILIFIIVFILLNGVVILFSLNQKVDLVTNNYYEKELKFQHDIDKQNNALPFADSILITVDNAVIQITFPVEHANQIESGIAFFYRPSDSKLDFQAELKLNQNGKQLFDAKTFVKGFWKATFEWEENNREYQVTKSFYVE